MNFIVLDTETTNSLEEPLAYDIGWAVVTEEGEVLKTESYAVAEIFLDKDLMSVAYFAEKIPQYWEEIKSENRKLARLGTIYRSLRDDCKAYEVKEVYAHNAIFDDLSLKLTQRFISGSKYRFFLPYGVKMCDTLKMSYKAFGKNEDYKKFCAENGYLTATHRPKMTAEVLYRFLTNNLDFEEVHKGLDDVLIEKEILVACRKMGVTEGDLF